MNREECFKKLLILEQTDYLDDNDRINTIIWYYKKDMWMDESEELDYSEKIYIEQVFDDYLWWRDKQLLFNKELEDVKRRTTIEDK